jgi:large subunit ribosomal protein L17
MRHGRKVNHLGRTASHRKAMLSNLATSLILSKRITTTVAKAKALRKYVEPLITKAKSDSMHSRRTVFSYLQNKESVKELFGTVASRTSERPGGYTRIIKMGDVRLGDNAEMCLIELVDFNEIYKKDGDAKKGKTRRGRAKAKKTETSEATAETSSEPVAEEKAAKTAKKTAKKSAPKKKAKE